jgi:hypothetical protein
LPFQLPHLTEGVPVRLGQPDAFLAAEFCEDSFSKVGPIISDDAMREAISHKELDGL